MSRVTGSVLLVGSVPGNSAHAVMDSCAKGLDDSLFALPDGETGYRQGWINFLAAKTYAASEQLESITRPQPVDPDDPDEWRAPGMDWMPRGFQDHWQFKVKEGTGPLHFEHLGYAQEARNSYQTFCTLRDQGIIPQGVRFQVSLPLIESGTRLFLGHSPESFQPMWDAYRDAMRREVVRLSQEIPPRDLAVQWDIAAEVASIESNDHDPMLGLPWDAPGDPFERYVQALVDLSQHVADETLLGLHLCYGDLGHKHFKQPQDLGVVVRMANAGVAAVSRPVDFVHMPVPRNRNDDGYFAPLADLAIADAKLFLGLVHHTDGIRGTLKRLETAQKHASGFGIATECGFGRRLPETIPALMRIHREAVARL